jgi:hypothetical protein
MSACPKDEGYLKKSGFYHLGTARKGLDGRAIHDEVKIEWPVFGERGDRLAGKSAATVAPE